MKMITVGTMSILAILSGIAGFTSTRAQAAEVPTHKQIQAMPADEIVATFKSLSREQLKEIYNRSGAGYLPDAGKNGENAYEGHVLVTTKGPIPGLSAKMQASLNYMAEFAWKGKVPYRDAAGLTNLVSEPMLQTFRTLSLKTISYKDDEVVRRSLTDVASGKELAVIEMFPAKLYCGVDTEDGKPAGIIDYSEPSEVQIANRTYQAKADYLMGKKALRVMDYIRMVRPGLYLGEAKSYGHFVLNFMLIRRDVIAGTATDRPADGAAGNCAN